MRRWRKEKKRRQASMQQAGRQAGRQNGDAEVKEKERRWRAVPQVLAADLGQRQGEEKEGKGVSN